MNLKVAVLDIKVLYIIFFFFWIPFLQNGTEERFDLQIHFFFWWAKSGQHVSFGDDKDRREKETRNRFFFFFVSKILFHRTCFFVLLKRWLPKVCVAFCGDGPGIWQICLCFEI